MFDGIPSRAKPAKTRPRKVADLLCGAGGSSTGAKKALERLGFEMELVCVNHWPIAIETHRKNHPTARHYCQDIASVRPAEICPEGYLDLLMASPTCTHHSRARGGKPTSDQQRTDPWHIVTWLTELRVKRLLIENVPEFQDWGPVDVRTGRPIKSRKGEYFRAWVRAIEALGFKTEWRVLNAADYGDATTRERFFLLGRSDRKPIRWPAPTHSKRGAGDLFGNGAQQWRPAREIIDWSIPGKSIFERKPPLSPKTLARIYAGAVKFRWPEPFLVVLRQHMDGKSLDEPLPTITAGGTHIGLAEPIIISTRQHTGGPAPRSADSPVPTLTATDSRIAVVEPFILNRHGKGYGATRAHPIDEPMPTADCRGAGYVVEPFILSRHAEGAPRSLEEPTPTQVAKHSHLLVEPMIAPYYGSGSGETCGSISDPLPTVTTKARFGMVMPVTHGDGSNRARTVEEPIPTVTCARRGELAFITAAFGERDGQAPRVHSIEEPTPTICAQGRVNLVQPVVVNMKGRSNASSVDAPAPTITAHARHLAVAEPGRDFDILFRMLEPKELAAAMGFSDEEVEYEFVGNKTQVTKQIGNAVPVNTASALVGALMEGG